MRKLIFVLIFGFLSISSTAVAIDIGSSYYITGCYEGELIIPMVNLWSASDGGVEGATIVGRVSGGNEKNLESHCKGAIVKVLDIYDEFMIKVQSINGKVGWVASGFIGEKVE